MVKDRPIINTERTKANAIARRVMDRLMGRAPVTRNTKLFTSEYLAEQGRYTAIIKTGKQYGACRRYSGGSWGYEEVE